MLCENLAWGLKAHRVYHTPVPVPVASSTISVYYRCWYTGTREEALEQRKTDAEVALELMRLVLEQAGSRRLSPTRTLALYHLCKEAVAYVPEGAVTADYLEDRLKSLLQ